MSFAKIKFYLINVFPTTPFGFRVVNFIYYCIRHCKKRDFIFFNNIQKDSFNIISVLIVKNEAQYLKEWIEYHRIIGIEHFVIYDNESTDNTRDLLNEYIQKGIVSYTLVKGAKQQMNCYEDAIARYRKITKWMSFTDVDEFIYMHNSNSLSEFLENYRNSAGIGINWNMFDSNEHETRPNQGFVISNFTRCLLHKDDLSENRHIKTIVNPKLIHHFSNPHLPTVKFPQSLFKRNSIVTENQEKISIPLTKANSTSKIQINHYFSKSKEEYIKKISRGRADNGFVRSPRKEDYDFGHLQTEQFYPNNDIIKKLEESIKDTYK